MVRYRLEQSRAGLPLRGHTSCAGEDCGELCDGSHCPQRGAPCATDVLREQPGGSSSRLLVAVLEYAGCLVPRKQRRGGLNNGKRAGTWQRSGL